MSNDRYVELRRTAYQRSMDSGAEHAERLQVVRHQFIPDLSVGLYGHAQDVDNSANLVLMQMFLELIVIRIARRFLLCKTPLSITTTTLPDNSPSIQLKRYWRILSKTSAPTKNAVELTALPKFSSAIGCTIVVPMGIMMTAATLIWEINLRPGFRSSVTPTRTSNNDF